MATTKDYIEYVCERLHGAGGLRYRKMFGEYMVYVNDKPVLLVCDNTVFVKIVPELAALVRVDGRRYGKTTQLSFFQRRSFVEVDAGE